MADQKITELTATMTVAGTDLVPVVVDPSGAAATKKITVAELFTNRAGIASDTIFDAKGDLAVGTGANTAAKLSVGSDAQKIIADAAAATGLKFIDDDFGIQVILGTGADVISTGLKGFLEIPFTCVIEAVRLFGDVAGAVVVDIWQDTYANFPPDDADSIAGAGTPPTITATNQKSETTTFTNWTTTTLTKGSILGFNVDSCTSIKQLTVSITGRKTALS